MPPWKDYYLCSIHSYIQLHSIPYVNISGKSHEKKNTLISLTTSDFRDPADVGKIANRFSVTKPAPCEMLLRSSARLTYSGRDGHSFGLTTGASRAGWESSPDLLSSCMNDFEKSFY